MRVLAGVLEEVVDFGVAAGVAGLEFGGIGAGGVGGDVVGGEVGDDDGDGLVLDGDGGAEAAFDRCFGEDGEGLDRVAAEDGDVVIFGGGVDGDVGIFGEGLFEGGDVVGLGFLEADNVGVSVANSIGDGVVVFVAE